MNTGNKKIVLDIVSNEPGNSTQEIARLVGVSHRTVHTTSTQDGQRGHQWHFGVNVWSAILNTQILRPVFLSNRPNADNYLRFLNDALLDILMDLSLTNVISARWCPGS
ncbi:hypothetical protein ILUMI_05955 [Ignelater luminosus]|uniref:Uncharacterized protein n=1 Tax=Ignelater luminosus TaxID=2038154 RepID=A0A8K0DGM9_IGNLU|nr:hypothetical protein ILUMI_05955 [Ignelater luminosus]